MVWLVVGVFLNMYTICIFHNLTLLFSLKPGCDLVCKTQIAPQIIWDKYLHIYIFTFKLILENCSLLFLIFISSTNSDLFFFSAIINANRKFNWKRSTLKEKKKEKKKSRYLSVTCNYLSRKKVLFLPSRSSWSFQSPLCRFLFSSIELQWETSH